MAKGPSSTAWWNLGALSSKALKDVCGLHFASKLMIGGRQGARQPGQSPQSAKGSLQGANRSTQTSACRQVKIPGGARHGQSSAAGESLEDSE